MRVAVHRLRQDLDIIEPRHRHAFEKVFDVAVAALPRVGVRLLVKAQIAVVEGGFVRPGELLVLDKVARKAPDLRRRLGPAETGLDETVGRLEILVH